MNAQDLKGYKADLEIKKAAEIAAINKKYERKLNALSVLLEDDEPEIMEADIEENAAQINGATNFSQAVKIAISNATDIFSSKTLFKYIAKNYPQLAKDKSPADISAPLWVMKKDGLIEPVTKGSGRRATTYRTTRLFAAME